MARNPRARRLDETVRAKLARILAEDISDPRIDLVTVTGVELTPDHSYADVYVIAHGDAERYAEALAGLESAKGRIRSLLARSVRTRTVPELRFHLDESVDEGMRINEALRNVPPTLEGADEVAEDAPDDEVAEGAPDDAGPDRDAE